MAAAIAASPVPRASHFLTSNAARVHTTNLFIAFLCFQPLDSLMIAPQNESDIAAAIASSPVPRASLFLTSKLSPYEMGASKALKAFESCLNRLGTDYVDLMLIHWPVSGML